MQWYYLNSSLVLTLTSFPFAIVLSFASVCDAPCWRQSSSVQTLNLADNGRSERGSPSTRRPLLLLILLFGRVVGGLSCRGNVDAVIGSGTGEEEIMNAKAVGMAIAYYARATAVVFKCDYFCASRFVSAKTYSSSRTKRSLLLCVVVS